MAVYPANENLVFDGSDVTFSLPSTQTLTQTGTFANGANPMAAYGTDENLQFKNLCGGLGIRLKGNAHVSGIRITADESEKLNGAFEADCMATEPVLVASQGNAGNHIVTLNCDVTLTEEAMTFFVVLPVGTLSEGFLMEVLDGEDVIAEKRLEGDLAQVERNTVKCLNAIEVMTGDETVIPEGAINGLFTVNENGTQVYFSQGNLQYQASNNLWRFAENQWNFVGGILYAGMDWETQVGNVEGSDNLDISESYDGWIDLFCWGTSGWNNGNVHYHPWDYEYFDGNVGGGYGPTDGTNFSYDLTGIYANADWGYNAISNGGNMGNSGWRTLTDPEWNYVFNTRNTESGIRYAFGSVNGVNGIVLLPDNWTASIYPLVAPNGGNYGSNTITTRDWESSLEVNGAIFLPSAGQRHGTTVDFAGDLGEYWSASCCDNFATGPWFLSNGHITAGGERSRVYGCSVRLVRNVE